jgi:hypothetical protein
MSKKIYKTSKLYEVLLFSGHPYSEEANRDWVRVSEAVFRDLKNVKL